MGLEAQPTSIAEDRVLGTATPSRPPAALEPLTERLIARLPGRARSWRLAWGLVPVLQSVAMTPLLTSSGLNPYGWALLAASVPANLVLSYTILHALWGVRRVVREALALEPSLVRMAAVGDGLPRHAFPGMGRAAPPFLLTLALTTILAMDALRLTSWSFALAKLPFDFLTYLPLLTLVWTYLMLTAGLKRLGKAKLALDAYCGDRSLGLHSLGRLASSGFWIFAANLAPVLLLNVTYGLGLFIGLAFFVAGVVAFFLSLVGLHGQMLRVKRHELARARDLYTQAYEPLRLAPSLERLKEQSPLLGAAEALECRADSIQTWPFSNAIFARIVVLASSVVTAVVTRVALDALGL